jgi:hypothetical protein
VIGLQPAQPRAGEPISFILTAPGSTTAQLSYRTRGESDYQQVSALGKDGRFDFAVPGFGVKSPGLEYFVIARTDGGGQVGVAGAKDRPLAVGVEGLQHKPFYRRPWFWGTCAGAVVVAVIVGAVAGTAPAHLTIQHP